MAKTAEKSVNESSQDETEIKRAQEPQTSDVPTLGLQDLALTLNLLNMAIKRGVFETNELRSVLDVYEKLEAFLQHQAQAQAAAQAQKAQTGET